MRDRRGSMAAVALALILSACGGDATTTAEVLPFDPRSTADVAAAGGASYLPITSSGLADLADLIVEIDVIDVNPSVLNTTDGRFPSAPELAAKATEGHPLVGLAVATPVDVRIRSILANPSGARTGGAFTIMVAGGAVSVTLDSDQARLLGILEVPDDAQEGPGAEEVEVPADGPVDITWGHSPDVVLTEGERYVVILDRRPLSRYDGTSGPVEWWVGRPETVWEPVSDGWVPQHRTNLDLATVVALVAGSGN